MRKHRRRIATFVAGVLVAGSVAGPAAAVPPSDTASYPRPVPAGQGLTPSDYAQRVIRAPVGDTKADLPGTVKSAAAGDTKSDSPGASRAPEAAPVTVEVVRPERTVVRDADSALPIVLAGLALLVAIGAGGTALVRMRSLRLS